MLDHFIKGLREWLWVSEVLSLIIVSVRFTTIWNYFLLSFEIYVAGVGRVQSSLLLLMQAEDEF